MNEKTLTRLFPEQRRNVKKGLCAECTKPVVKDDMKNEMSRREFDLSGMCQKCQDNFFNSDEAMDI